MTTTSRFILKLSCPDRAGIVHAVTGFLLAQGGNILTSAQHGDADHQRFFMRIEFESAAELTAMRDGFAPLADSAGDGLGAGGQRHQDPRAAAGLQARPLPERPAVPRADRPSADRDRRHRQQPPRFLSARGFAQHSRSTTCRC